MSKSKTNHGDQKWNYLIPVNRNNGSYSLNNENVTPLGVSKSVMTLGPSKKIKSFGARVCTGQSQTNISGLCYHCASGCSGSIQETRDKCSAFKEFKGVMWLFGNDSKGEESQEKDTI
ncbi:hypothetical protein Tco_1386544 [Tanacetum coccineum]